MLRKQTLVTGCLALSSWLLGAEPAEGQRTPPVDCGTVDGGTIRGVVINASTRKPVSGSYIYLFIGPGCRADTDALGRFIVQGVPSGPQRIQTGSTGYRQFTPVTVEVAAGDTSYVELQLDPGGPLEDCRALPECAPLVDGGSAVSLSEDDNFRVVALGTAIGLAWETVAGNARWHACLENERAAVLDRMRDRFSAVVDFAECEIPDLASLPGARQMRHVATNSSAFVPRVDRIVELSPNRRTVALSLYVGPRWGAGWDCDFERTELGWRATLCNATWVS